jgi:hypothetical protein
MNFVQQADDAPDFIQQVEEAVNGALRLHSPEALVLIKIDNWFGFKWLGFCGKAPGALRIWHLHRNKLTKGIRIPAFVPDHVVSQRRFAAPRYEEIDSGRPLHRKMKSRFALQRRASIEAPKAAFAWYSGNSAANGRGALMMYIPVERSYWAWYAGLHSGEPWRLGKTLLIDPEGFALLRRAGRELLVQS